MKDKIIFFITDYALLGLGSIILIISLIGLRNGYLDKKITERNNIEVVKVISCYDSGNNHYFIKFEHNNKTFVKRTKGYYCQKISGKTEIEMLSNESNDRFIFLDELKNDNDFLFGSILSILSILTIYFGIKKVRSKTEIIHIEE